MNRKETTLDPDDWETIRALVPNDASDDELIPLGNLLISAIVQKTGMSETIVHYGLEDLLCIYQKQSDYENFLDAVTFDKGFTKRVLGNNCVRERGIC